MITITIENARCKITGLDDPSVVTALDDELSFKVLGSEFTKAVTKGWWDPKKRSWQYWDGVRRLLTQTKCGYSFPTGLIERVKRELDKFRVDYKIVDKRPKVKFGKKIKTKNIEPREYQKKVLDKILETEMGVVKVATGGGKSVIITNLVANTNVKTNIYVVGTDLLYQLKETFEDKLGTEVGIIGDGRAEIRKINVCSVWTAVTALGKKYEKLDDEDYAKKERFSNTNKAKIAKAIKDAEMAIYDECHMLATNTLQLINAASTNARYCWGFSGTPFRDDNCDLLIEAVCGERIVEVTATELIKKGFLVEPKINFINIPPKNDLPEKYPSVYKEYIVENDVRNDKIISAVCKLLKSGRKVLILVKNISHGHILLDKLGDDVVSYFVRGELSSEERNRIRQEFSEGKIDVIVATVVYDMGIDVPILDALVLAAGGKSSTRALQRIGRCIRTFEGKKDAIVVDFIDNAKYLLKHTAKRIQIYRTEPGFKIILPDKEKTKKANAAARKKNSAKPRKKKPETETW